MFALLVVLALAGTSQPTSAQTTLLERLDAPDPAVATAAEAQLVALSDRERAAVAEILTRRILASPAADRDALHLGLCGAPALPSLRRVLTDPDARVRALALRAAERYSGAAGELVPLVTAGLRDPDPGVREAATRVLFRLERPPRELAPALTGALRRTIAQRAALPATTRGGSGRQAVETRQEADRLERTRLELVRALGRMGPLAFESASALAAALAQSMSASPWGPDEICERAAIEALGAVRSSPEASLPALFAAFGESCCHEAAATTISLFGDPAAALIRARSQELDAFTRTQALAALARIDSPLARSVERELRTEEAIGRRQEQERSTAIVSRAAAVAPMPPSPESPAALADVWARSVSLKADELLVVALRSDRGCTAGETRRADRLRMFRRVPGGYRRLLDEDESACGARYDAVAFQGDGRQFLHLVRLARAPWAPIEGPLWRLDRVFELAGDRLAPLAIEPSVTPCGRWLPRLGQDESASVVFDFGARWRFGVRFVSDPSSAAVRWLGELAPGEAGAGLVVARCDIADGSEPSE